MSHTRKILVLRPEDRQATWAPLAGILTGEGYDVADVGDAARVMQSVGGETPPDLVLLDTAPSNLDALGVCAQIKGSALTQSIPVLCAAPESNGAMERAFSAGADDFLSQPVDAQLLLGRARSLLRNKRFCDEVAADLQRLTQIGIGLSAEHDLDRLLERILDEARAINNADAGTLYTVDRDAEVLRFQIAHNETLGTRMGGTSGNLITFQPVPLDPIYVSGHVALTGETVNILDAYEAEGFDFSGTRKYDAMTGYRSRSMLVVPMRNHENEVIAVLQLLNARKSGTTRVGPFLDVNVERTRALASQAGIALNNTKLIHDLQAFLEGLIQVMAAAVDEKSPYTSGHIQRVTRLGVLLGEALNQAPERYDGRSLNAEELDELRIAGLLHDIGKIVIPEHVVDKATKLQTVYDRINVIRMRFELIRMSLENAALHRKLSLVTHGASAAEMAAVETEVEEGFCRLTEDLVFLESINQGGEFMAPEKLERLKAIAARTFTDAGGAEQPYLTQDEVDNLSIARGTLLPWELQIIRSHAAVSIRLLSRIPFGRRLRCVPIYAGDHHEALNGSGYPNGKTAEQLPLQSRILAIADIFDALTSSDRPYKKAFSEEFAHKILREETERGKLDGRLVELFIDSGCFRKLQAELSAEEGRAPELESEPAEVR